MTVRSAGEGCGTGPATVLYVARAPFFSGAERALLLLAERLDRSRFRPVVAVGTEGELAERLRAGGIETVHVPIAYSGVRTAIGWARSVAGFARVLRRTGAVLVHGNDLQSFQPAGYAARLLGVPSACHLRFPDTKRGYEWFLRPQPDRTFFISQSFQQSALKEAPKLFGGRSEVIYDGVQVMPEPDTRERLELRGRLGLPRDAFCVVLSGQVAEVKGIWEFLDAAAMLDAQEMNVHFSVIGDDLRTAGRLRQEAESRVRRNRLEARVTFVGFVRDAHTLLPAFDLVAVPSHVEPLGLSALEGMAAARPVVGSDVGGIAETVVHEHTGLLVRPKDASALAAAIGGLAADPARAARMGARGRERVLEHFGIDTHVARIQQAYDQILTTSSNMGTSQ
ncbi:MAG: glycosyltransferase family 4 protein [Vicinamibacterales bacterium]